MASSLEVAPETWPLGEGAGAGRVGEDQDACWAWSGPVPLVLPELVLSCQACLTSGWPLVVRGPCRSLQPSSCRRRGGSGSSPVLRERHCERLFPSICRAAALALTQNGLPGEAGMGP